MRNTNASRWANPIIVIEIRVKVWRRVEKILIVNRDVIRYITGDVGSKVRSNIWLVGFLAIIRVILLRAPVARACLVAVESEFGEILGLVRVDVVWRWI